MKKSTNLERLHKGNFNTLNKVRLLDGSVIITLSKRGEKPTKFRVKNLYQDNEEEVALESNKCYNEGNIQGTMPGVSKEDKGHSKRKGNR